MRAKGITLDEWQAEMERVLEAETEAYKPRRPWSPQEDEILAKFYGRVPTAKIAVTLDRSIAATYMRAERIGLKVGKS